ncbi:MAG: LytTR family DNA-binding domain-containing protein [Rikenellaceae bacterium]
MISCIVIDDEPLALAQLEQYAEKTPTLELKASFDSALDALSYLRDNSVELIFVDINMPQISGLEFAKVLSKDIKLVFVTAHREFALEGFTLDAADYLLKPLSYDAFLSSVEKINTRYFSHTATPSEKDYIFVRSELRSVKVNFSDILYIESKREYLDIHIVTGAIITTHGSLSSFEDKLPKDKFLKVHRSFIVNLSQIKLLERGNIIFGKQYIPISESAREKVMLLVNN